MSPNTSHFLHLTRKRYRKQQKLLEGLYECDSFLVRPNQVVKNRKLIKYWSKRNNLFSKFNERPIYLTDELWYSVTPEKIAKFVAKFARACLPNAKKVLDVFCGAGGNTIQLALEFERVYGVDWSMEHLYCTQRNAEAYGVSDNIWLKYGSWEAIARKGRFSKIGVDFLFGSPPWGGPQYLRESTYDLEKLLQPMGITQMLQSMISITSNVMLFLPRNSNLEQVSSATRQVLGLRGRCRVVYVKEDGFPKGILCMWGDALVKAGGEDEEPDEKNASKKKDAKHDVDYSLDG
ncbi:TGS1 (YPL157W) [Zygosaccharomyces parabailii]|nr:TGS1 (YPL157W) [Zygosaccharomyces parabailii]CDH08782.1 related to Trimethylguanosine synthase [Zygosaccharomyces bailii ISA1307]